MAEKSRSPWRGLVALLILIAVTAGTLTVGHFTRENVEFVPKLALDLEGGTQVILTPKAIEGTEARAITAEDMNQAINIIRQRIDASGVAEAEISTLGSNNIVVAIPGEASEETLNQIRSSALMQFRSVLVSSSGAQIDPSDITAQSGSQSGSQSTDQSTDQSGSQSGVAATADQYAAALADLDQDGIISNEVTTTAADNSDTAWVTEQLYYDFLMLDCTDPASRNNDSSENVAGAVISCSDDGAEKYILGPVDIDGTHVSSAAAGMIYNTAGNSTGQWGVDIALDAEGTKQFADVSKRLVALKETDATRNRFAMVLDGNVISAPTMNEQILNGKAQISGNFTAKTAQVLANQLSFGSLPLNFEVQSEDTISATLGTNHLEKGIWAGLIGLLLVVLYMVWQYRGLAVISAGSLILAALMTYLGITVLSWLMGYRLSLPGVAGLIVAVGITADSFIVYFERIRDEVRDGFPLSVAVERGWNKAKRTILISDAVNLVAALILYILAVGGVQGFAFTLGLTTVVDLLVIFMFTHPMMALLMRTKFFGGGHPLSGLDPEHLGAHSSAVYAGRGQFRTPKQKNGSEDSTRASGAGSSIAARKRAEKAEAAVLEAKVVPESATEVEGNEEGNSTK